MISTKQFFDNYFGRTGYVRILIFLIPLIIEIGCYTSGIDTESILKEGKMLYRLENASWNATDHFFRHFKDEKDGIGGSLSYIGEDNRVYTIFWSRYDSSFIIARYIFDSLPGISPISVDIKNRAASAFEKNLIQIKQDAINRISKNEDGFFTSYKDTSFNLVPVVANKERKVFVLTAARTGKYVLIGNDYLLTYDNNNNLLKKEKLHNSLIQLSFKSESTSDAACTTMHTHILSDYITSTDICTLLLYKDFVEWKRHYVISKKYVSILDLEKESLSIKAF